MRRARRRTPVSRRLLASIMALCKPVQANKWRDEGFPNAERRALHFERKKRDAPMVIIRHKAGYEDATGLN